MSQKAQIADATWQNLLHGYLFLPEAQRIIGFLNEHGNLSQEKSREIRIALQMNECQFDCSTVSAYLQQEDPKLGSLMSNANSGTDFQSYIRVNSRRTVEQ